MSVVLAVSAGLGLTSIAGLPSPAGAAPPVIAGVPEPPDRQKQLEKALITEKDVPAGYLKQDMGDFGAILASMLTSHEAGADPCDMPDDMSSLSATGPMIGMEPPPAGSAPSEPSPAPAAPEPVKAGPPEPEPVKGSPPPPPVIEEDPELTPTAGAFFLHEKTGAVAIEALAAVGEDEALEMIDQVQEVLEECPLIQIEGMKITTRPLAWNPPLGDESITGTLSLEARFFGVDISAKVKFAQVAYRDVALTVGMIGADDPKDRELKKIARAAVRKLVTTSGITISRPAH